MKNPYPKDSIQGIMWGNLEIYKACSQPFRTCFQVHLAVFWDNHMTGFNLARFDEEVLHSADGQSIRDAVLEQYGEQGVVLIETLIKTQEEENEI